MPFSRVRSNLCEQAERLMFTCRLADLLHPSQALGSAQNKAVSDEISGGLFILLYFGSFECFPILTLKSCFLDSSFLEFPVKL